MPSVEGSIAHSLSPVATTSSTATHLNTQWVATEQDSARLGRRQELEKGGGMLECLGAFLMRPFKALHERISHLLCSEDGPGARASDVDESLVPPVIRRVSSPSPYQLAGAENRPYGLLMDRTVKSLEAAASVLGQEKTWVQRLLKCLYSLGKLFMCRTGNGESQSPDKQKFKALFNACRNTGTAQGDIGRPLDGVRDVNLGLNALYLAGFGRALTVEAVQGLEAAKKKGAPAVHEFAARLNRTKDVATRYRSLSLEQVLKVMSEGQYFLNKGDALAVFLGGIAAFSKELAQQRENVQKRVPQDQHIEASVQNLLGALTPAQKDRLRLRLNDFLAEKAYRVFDFAREQSSLSREDWVGEQLFRLSVGEQVMEPLLKQLDLQPRDDDALVDIPSVDEFDIDELAALSRVLVPPQIHTPKVGRPAGAFPSIPRKQ